MQFFEVTLADTSKKVLQISQIVEFYSKSGGTAFGLIGGVQVLAEEPYGTVKQELEQMGAIIGPV